MYNINYLMDIVGDIYFELVCILLIISENIILII